MLLYRVVPYLASATPGEPGHPSYVHRPQGRGRLDNPSAYDCWYLSEQEAGAVGEVFADLLSWTDDMFAAPYLPGATRALAAYEITDDTRCSNSTTPATSSPESCARPKSSNGTGPPRKRGR